jgi:tRNA (cytidine/uridine-2'-O-)-methyltransferase
MESPEPGLHIALIHPQIGPNAGNIGRLCLGIGACLHLVHPLGFSTSDKAVRRAGLDYWKHVRCIEHPDLDGFLTWAGGRRVFAYSARSQKTFTEVTHKAGDVLVFGREADGLPSSLKNHWPVLQIPIAGPIRSLNLSNAVAIVAYGALAQVRPELFPPGGPHA